MSTTSYTPDGHVAQVEYPDRVVDYTYDAAGNRLTMEDSLGVSSWAYDWAGRVVSETDARGHTTTHTFDLSGNLAGIAYPDGRTVARTFDGRGLVVSQTDTTAAGASSVTTFSYDETGAMIGQVRPSGVTADIDRDLVGRVTGVEYTGLGVTGNPLPSGEVNPSSGAPGNAYGHCKDNGNGHPNQQPAGCSTDTLAFEYEYDERGLISQRDVISDEATTQTLYTHDDLGRLTRSVTGSAATIYVWDAASNLVGEGGTDDPSTTKTGDAYAIARTVNEANELVTSVKTPVGTPGGKVATTAFSYDERGNRTGQVTTTQTGNKTHVVASVSYAYDGMDQLTSTSGPEGSASWVRDGAGRALTVTEDGVASARLYDGFQVVAEGDTQIATAPNGQVLAETTTTTTTKGKNTTTTVDTVDVLTEVLGSAVATASDGVISADLALYGDFGDLLTTRKPATSKTDTVTGFTGQVETAGLLEFASRTYDPATRQWVQDDRYRGTTTRAASMNRYAYVEGAPESFVDVLGFYRARAAVRAQALASLNAQLQSALAGLEGLYGAAWKYGQDLSYAQMLKIYDNLSGGLAPEVKAVLDPIVRSLVNQVKDVHAAQKLEQMIQQHNQEVAQAAIDEWVRQERLYQIEQQWAKEQQEAYHEMQSQWFYNSVSAGAGQAVGILEFVWDTATYGPHQGAYAASCAFYWDTCWEDARLQREAIAGLASDWWQGEQSAWDVVLGNKSIGDHWDDTIYPFVYDYVIGDTMQKVQTGDYFGAGRNVGYEEAGIAAILIPGGAALRSQRLTSDAARLAEASRATSLDDLAALRALAGERSALAPGGGLAAQEAAGGHTIALHVEQTVPQLVQRLALDSRIPAASTFTTRAEAERLVLQTIDANQADIAAWLASNPKPVGAQFDLTGLQAPTGVTVLRGTTVPVNTYDVRVVLVPDATSPLGFRILTAFPK